jgi:hypothetical protein
MHRNTMLQWQHVLSWQIIATTSIRVQLSTDMRQIRTLKLMCNTTEECNEIITILDAVSKVSSFPTRRLCRAVTHCVFLGGDATTCNLPASQEVARAVSDSTPAILPSKRLGSIRSLTSRSSLSAPPRVSQAIRNLFSSSDLLADVAGSTSNVAAEEQDYHTLSDGE